MYKSGSHTYNSELGLRTIPQFDEYPFATELLKLIKEQDEQSKKPSLIEIQSRKWTDKAGNEWVGSYQDYESGKVVLMLLDGSTQEIKTTELSTEDQRWFKDWRETIKLAKKLEINL